MMTRLVMLVLVALGGVFGNALAQENGASVQEGRRLAILICANCHVAAPNQPNEPILRPPAPAFEAIAQRGTTSIESVEAFLKTTHRDISNPQGMPNPQLLDSQIKDVAAYILSMRKGP